MHERSDESTNTITGPILARWIRIFWCVTEPSIIRGFFSRAAFANFAFTLSSSYEKFNLIRLMKFNLILIKKS